MAENRQDSNRGPFEQLGEQMGGMVGKMAGRMNDRVLNVASQVLGTGLQQMSDWWTSHDAQAASSSFRDREDEACRRHYQETHGSGSASGSSSSSPQGIDNGGIHAVQRDYEAVRPLYQFGHLAGENPEYRDRPFEQVELDLQGAWNEAGRERYGDWTQVRDQVGFGYSMRQGESSAPLSGSASGGERSTGHLEMDVPLELDRGPAKQHGDALQAGNGNRHGLHERGERPNL